MEAASEREGVFRALKKGSLDGSGLGEGGGAGRLSRNEKSCH